MNKWLSCWDKPPNTDEFTIHGYKCSKCDRPVLATISTQIQWDTNIASYKFCPHCGEPIEYKNLRS